MGTPLLAWGPIAASTPWAPALFIALPVAIVVLQIVFLATRYRRCAPNEVLVVYGKVGAKSTARCIHGGGALVWPFIQDSASLSLEPRTIEVDLREGLAHHGVREEVPASFTFAVSTRPEILQRATERLLGLSEESIRSTAREVVVGQVRAMGATWTPDDVNRERDRFVEVLRACIDAELGRIGLELTNVNVPAQPVPRPPEGRPERT